MIVTPTDRGLRIRSGPSTGHSILGSVNPGDRLAVLEPNGAEAKLGQRGMWLRVRAANGTVGYSAAWFLAPATLPADGVVLPDGYPVTEVEGYARALGFSRTPTVKPAFVRLPCELSKIGPVGWFGPNNYSYLVRESTTYRYANGLHSGIDFGIDVGVPLVAMDWGVVVWASRWAYDTPWGAGPYVVMVRHRDCVALYGHVSRMIFVERGDVVKPGDVLCHAGTDGKWAHLHLEVRRIDDAYIESLRLPAAALYTDPGEQAAMMNALFDHDRENLSQREHWLNPAQFFTTPLEDYGFSRAALHHTDTDGDGYPDLLQWHGLLLEWEYRNP